MTKVCIAIANGFEEIEAVSLIDILRRADIEVLVAGVDSSIVEGSHQIRMETDCSLKEVKAEYIDMIILPGGMQNAETLMENTYVQTLLKEMDTQGKLIGAICAAPLALDTAGVLKSTFTCYPSLASKIKASNYDNEKLVVSDQNVMTSKGPATAMIFALEIVKRLKGEARWQELKTELLFDLIV